MFAITNKVYASAKHSAVRGMCANPDMLVFSWHKLLFILYKTDFLNSCTLKYFTPIYGGKNDENTAIRRKKTPSKPELRPVSRRHDRTR